MASTGLDFAKLTPDNGAVRDLRELIFLSVMDVDQLGALFNFLPNQEHGKKVGMIGEERAWRERHGTFMQELARRADHVTRVFCGLTEGLK